MPLFDPENRKFRIGLEQELDGNGDGLGDEVRVLPHLIFESGAYDDICPPGTKGRVLAHISEDSKAKASANNATLQEFHEDYFYIVSMETGWTVMIPESLLEKVK